MAASGPDAKTCWCFDVPVGIETFRRMNQSFAAAACFCADCLAAAVGDPLEPAVAGRDYYVTAAGTLVFTAAYHLRRGHCCGSDCRHCPYPKRG